jgi:hypothetical protein
MIDQHKPGNNVPDMLQPKQNLSSITTVFALEVMMQMRVGDAYLLALLGLCSLLWVFGSKCMIRAAYESLCQLEAKL